MSYKIKSFIIISLLIAATHGNFINFEEGMEYNFHFNSNLTTEEDEGTSSLTLFDANLKLQKISEYKFYGQFHNSKDEKLQKPFSIEIDGTKIKSIFFPLNVSMKEQTEAYIYLMPLIIDHTGISKNTIDTKNFKLKTGLILYVMLGLCGEHAEKDFDELQRGPFKHCKYALDIRNIWISERETFKENQSESLFLEENLENSTDAFTSNFVLKIKTLKSVLKSYLEQCYNLLDTKKIEDEIVLSGELRSLIRND